MCINSLQNRFVFISHSPNKTKHTMKENHFGRYCSQDVFSQTVKELGMGKDFLIICKKQYEALKLEEYLLTTCQE